MKRLVLYLVVLGLVLYLAKAVAPLIIVGVAGLVLLAWKRPDTVARLAVRPQLARMPARLRATPMRFAGSVAFGGFLLVALMAPVGVADAGQPQSSPTPRPVAAATPTPEPTREPTPERTARPTPRPTAAPTPTPEPTPVFGEEPTGPTEIGTVVNIVDGDTIDVVVNGVEMRVRYIGMDTPEVHSGVEWLGPESSAANSALVAGKEVVLEKDVSETDQYGRALRYVWVDDDSGWLLVNLELIRLGFASVTTYPPDVKYVDELYLAAQAEAQTAGVGRWEAAPTPVPVAAPTAAPILPIAAPPTNCHGSYIGYCVIAGIGDWDCASGSGNGPNYLPVTVQVVGPDEYGLDGNADGFGCES
jgi:micrococcal nuclease